MNKKRRRRENIAGYSFILPALTCLITFTFVPMVLSLYYGLTDYNGAKGPFFVGLRNFRLLFKDPAVIAAIKNTLLYVVISVPVQTVISLVLAAILAAHFQNRFGNFVRSTLFVPVVCSASVVATVWYIMFTNDPDGPVNVFTSLFGFPARNWLGKMGTAFLAITFVNIWKGVGYYLVIFYAGIMDVPRTLFEAAEVDGATKFQQFLHITLPSLKPITYLVVTLCSISSFKIFDISFTMTAGGPGYATTTLVHRIYIEAFKNYKFGYASAVAMVMLVIIVILTILERRAFREQVN